MRPKHQPSNVPLTAAAMELLRRRSETRSGAWVFPGKKPNSHLVEPMKAWRRMLKKAKITNSEIARFTSLSWKLHGHEQPKY